MEKKEKTELFPVKKKANKGKSIFNVRSLLDKKFYTVFDTEAAKNHPDTPYWKSILGDMEGSCNIIVYGRSGSGKSVFVLQLLQYLSEVFGKAAYNSWEERVNKTLADRVRNFMKLDEKTGGVKNVWFLSANSFEELCDRIQRLYLRIVVIDSVQYARFTVDQLKELHSRFAKRKIIYILVSFGTSEGKTRNADDLLHAADIKLYIHKGQLSVTNRYLGKSTKIKLFEPDLSVELPEPDEMPAGIPDLFNKITPEDGTQDQK